MKRIVLFCCFCFCFCNPGFGFSGNDSVIVNINNALINGTKVYIPVSLYSIDSVHSLDFAIKFDEQILTFDSIINLTSGLQYLYYLNPNDSVLRFTSNHFLPLTVDSPIVNIVFNTNTIQVCAADFDSVVAYLNGDSCFSTASGCTYLTSAPWEHEENKIRIYPNPASDRLEVHFSKHSSLQIFNINGETVPIAIQHINDHISIDVSTLSNGIYFCRLIIDNAPVTKKFLVSH